MNSPLCNLCKKPHRSKILLFCDECKCYLHSTCLKIKIDSKQAHNIIRSNNWKCENCQITSNSSISINSSIILTPTLKRSNICYLCPKTTSVRKSGNYFLLNCSGCTKNAHSLCLNFSPLDLKSFRKNNNWLCRYCLNSSNSYNPLNCVQPCFPPQVFIRDICPNCIICDKSFKKGRATVYQCDECEKSIHPICLNSFSSLFIFNVSKLICPKCIFPFSDLANDDEVFNYVSDVFRFDRIGCDPPTTLAKGLKVVHLNVRSLNSSKLNHLIFLIDLYKLDVITLSETWLDSNSCENLNIVNYNVFRQDRVREGGGLLAFIHIRFSSQLITTPIIFDNEVEYLATSISFPNSKPLITVAFYRPPGYVSIEDSFFVNLNSLILFLVKISTDIVFLGDFNFNLLSKFPAAHENVTQFCKYGFSQLIVNPTRETDQSQTLIDHIYYGKLNYVADSGVIPVHFSDHHLIYLVIKKPKIHFASKYIKTWNYKRIDDPLLCAEYEKPARFECVLSSINVNNKLYEFNSTGLNILKTFCPPLTRRIRSRVTSPWMNGDLTRLSHSVHCARAKKLKLKKCLDSSWSLPLEISLKTISEFYRSHRNKLNALLKQSHNKCFSDQFANSKTPKQAWSIFKNLIGQCQQARIITSLINAAGVTITQNDEIADCLHSAFTVSRPDPTVFLLNMHASLLPVDFPDFDFSSVKSLLESRKGESCLGIEGLPSRIIKKFSLQLLPYICDIFKSSLLSGWYPDDWKVAVITPHLKKDGKSNDPLSYRPISSLPFLSKIFETYISKLILFHLLEQNINLNPRQYGFTKGKSTFHATFELLDSVYNFLDKNFITLIVFLDLSKAFDSISYPKLIHKLKHEFKLPDYLLKLIVHYLLNRSFKIVLGSYVSSPFPLHSGVPQGSVLGPLLFLLYFDSIKNILEELALLFADDIGSPLADRNLECLLKRLDALLERVHNWCADNDMALNAKKTKYMFVFKPPKYRTKLDKSICNLPFPNAIRTPFGSIERVKSFCYLGLNIDELLSFDKHIKIVNAKMSFKSNQLIKNKRAISTKLMPTVYKATVIPHLDFALPFFSHSQQLSSIQKTIDFFLKCYYVKGYSYRRFFHVNMAKANKLTPKANATSCLGKVKFKSPFDPVGYKELLTFYERFGIQTAPERAEFLTLTNIFSILNTDTNNHLKDLFINPASTIRRSHRLVNLEVSRFSSFLKTSFKSRGIGLFNSLPPKLKLADSKQVFKVNMRKWLNTKRLNNYVFFD
jgi:Reverse transcriptase (RNA-dependent DNA polymerase)